MEHQNKIPPKSEWNDLTIMQLYDVKSQIADTYYNMRSINASFSNQYLQYLSEVDALIRGRETAAAIDREGHN